MASKKAKQLNEEGKGRATFWAIIEVSDFFILRKASCFRNFPYLTHSSQPLLTEDEDTPIQNINRLSQSTNKGRLIDIKCIEYLAQHTQETKIFLL